MLGVEAREGTSESVIEEMEPDTPYYSHARNGDDEPAGVAGQVDMIVLADGIHPLLGNIQQTPSLV